MALGNRISSRVVVRRSRRRRRRERVEEPVAVCTISEGVTRVHRLKRGEQRVEKEKMCEYAFDRSQKLVDVEQMSFIVRLPSFVARHLYAYKALPKLEQC
jgi:hypothetical protein